MYKYLYTAVVRENNQRWISGGRTALLVRIYHVSLQYRSQSFLVPVPVGEILAVNSVTFLKMIIELYVALGAIADGYMQQYCKTSEHISFTLRQWLVLYPGGSDASFMYADYERAESRAFLVW